MRLSFGQEMRLAQKQVLAPRMIQSMEILQLPIMALQERIEQELQENEMLDLDLENPDLPDESEDEKEKEDPDSPTAEERELVVDESNDNEEDFERLNELEEQFPENFDYEEQPRVSSTRIEEFSQRKHDAMANAVARPQTLQDYLRDQLGYFDIDPALKAMAERIIYNLDSNGRLQGRLEDLLGPHASPEDLELAERALEFVQRLDPPGVGARNLRECLLLQLTPGMPYYDELRTLISDHLEDIEHNRLPQIERKTGYSLSLIQEILGELRKLNPKPGAEFSEAYVAPVVPDLFVDRNQDGTYTVRLEDTSLPHLHINSYYRRLIANGQADSETRSYIKKKMNSAQWLIDAIGQRRHTLSRVAQAICDHQTRFLEEGPEAIEPLKMQQIADKVGVHVTTVSRAVDGKWIQTPRGIFPLKRFFVGGTVSADGEEVAWDTVRLKLQEIIDAEDKRKPLSDDDLVGKLAAEGLKVARRTVTKYRKAMNIPSSRERKDWNLIEEDKQKGKKSS